MGICNGMVINESPQSLAKIFESYFDRIMVDAPCSGEGMFRKNTDACEEWSPENVENCAMRQQEILTCAAFMLRPGGRIVYSTCTFAPEENEGTISRFLEEHPEFHMVEVTLYEGMSPDRNGRNIRQKICSLVFGCFHTNFTEKGIFLRFSRRKAKYQIHTGDTVLTECRNL